MNDNWIENQLAEADVDRLKRENAELRDQVKRLEKQAERDHRGYSESRRTLRDYIERLEEKIRKKG